MNDLDCNNRDNASHNGRYKTQVTGHRLQVIVLPIQRVSLTFITTNLGPKNFSLVLIRPKVSFYEC